jgi:hypothetical protein
MLYSLIPLLNSLALVSPHITNAMPTITVTFINPALYLNSHKYPYLYSPHTDLLMSAITELLLISAIMTKLNPCSPCGFVFSFVSLNVYCYACLLFLPDIVLLRLRPPLSSLLPSPIPACVYRPGPMGCAPVSSSSAS